jgi:mannosyl-3-phosphoglycerate phosphatase
LLSGYHKAGTMSIKNSQLIIFTDLDGTLLDYHNYSCERAAPLVSRLKGAGIIIVFCSSKTRAEQELYRRKLGNSSPFIVEDGGAIFIKKGYFPFHYDYQRVIGSYHVIELGMPYKEIGIRLNEVKQKNNLSFRGFGDMDTAQVASVTGLDMVSAGLAQKREYEETLNLTGSEEETNLILNKIEKAGLKWTRGTRFYGVTGGNDKGKAVKILIGLFNRKLGRIKTIGIGDSLNDVPMLAEVDIPVLVQKPGNYWEEVELSNIYRVEGVGPEGWVRAVEKFIAI